jgi:hypothetical protein
MYRRLLAAVAVVFLLGTAVPAFSAPKRDAGSSVVSQIILKLKKIFLPTPMDLNDPSLPKP